MADIKDRPGKKPPLGDFALVHFETYEDYLDSLYNPQDICYLQSVETCRTISEFGYRRDGKTLSREEFTEKRNKVLKYLTPLPMALKASEGFRFGDPAQNALAIRERANRVGIMATIIFISYYTPKGQEVSGYIDFAHSLFKKNWKQFFRDNKPVYPSSTDLGYFHWKKKQIVVNDSLYYKTVMSPKHGLMFHNKYDRMLIRPDPYLRSPGNQTYRFRVFSKMYNNFVLYDHVMRCRK